MPFGAIGDTIRTDPHMALRMLVQRQSEMPVRRPRNGLPLADAELGFLEERCHACGAHLHLADDDTVSCLNLCSWPYWMVQQFHARMAEVSQAIARRDQIAEEVLAVL